MNKSVFSGKNSVLDYLNPDKNEYIPLVEIPRVLNPFYNDKVRIYTKLMNTLPLTNVKSLPALNMLFSSKDLGELDQVNTLIENSSGNTVLSLAVIGKLLGIDHTKAIVSNEVSRGKLNLLRLFGVEVIVNKEAICPDPKDKTSGIYKSKILASKHKDWFNPGQYTNENNPKAHEKWTGPQIWDQTEGEISIFCAGVGTTGTIQGTSKFLKSKSNSITTVGVSRIPNNPVPGVRTKNLLEEIPFIWKQYVDELVEIGTKESFKSSLDLCRFGLVVGPSSGFAFEGLLKFLKKQNNLDKFRNKNGEIIAVFISCDSPIPYVDEYFEYLGESEFPKIENEYLLPKNSKSEISTFNTDSKYEISVRKAYNMIFKSNPNIVWSQVLSDKLVEINKNIKILDIRKKNDFLHYHIPGSLNIEYEDLEDNISKYVDILKSNKIIVVCNYGISSQSASKMLRDNNIESYSVSGGMSEWSRDDLPRWKPDICNLYQ
jgi:cysteine synthase/rhodanese-related sulfurtransferase